MFGSSPISSDIYEQYGLAIEAVRKECPRDLQGIDHIMPNGRYCHGLSPGGHVVCIDREMQCAEIRELYPIASPAQMYLSYAYACVMQK